MTLAFLLVSLVSRLRKKIPKGSTNTFEAKTLQYKKDFLAKVLKDFFVAMLSFFSIALDCRVFA